MTTAAAGAKCMGWNGLPMTLILPSDLNLLSIARAFVESVCHAGGIDKATTNAIVLATNEATSNIIRHAHRDRSDVVIEIRCQFVAEGIEIMLVDEGAPFDLAAVPHLNPAEIRIGGRGVFLMRSLMDELACEPRSEGGNTLRMVKYCDCRFPRSGCG